MNPKNERTAVVLSGGGERIVAWQTGVLAGLADAGIDLRSAVAIAGTSGGALVAARLAVGQDPRKKADSLSRREYAPIPVPDLAPFELLAEAFAAAGSTAEGRRRMGQAALSMTTARSEESSIALAAARLPEADWPATLRLVSIDTELAERFVIDSGSNVELAVGVAASRAVPGLLPPITVAGRTLMDGSIGSATNADLVLDANPDRVFIISAFPTDRRHPRLAALCQEALDNEIAALTERGIAVTLIQANDADMDLMGPDPMNASGAPLAVRSGRMRGRMAARTKPAPKRRLRAAVAAHAGTALALLAFAGSAPAATTIGQAIPPNDETCFDGDTFMQTQVAAGGPSYRVPAPGGVITSFSVHDAVRASQNGKVRIYRRTGQPRFVAESEEVSLTQPGVKNTFLARIPVTSGDEIAWASTRRSSGCMGETNSTADVVALDKTVILPSNEPFEPLLPEQKARLNLEAVVEPDVDGDGFGDETQDRCPTDAERREPCLLPPAPPVIDPPAGEQPQDPAPPTVPSVPLPPAPPVSAPRDAAGPVVRTSVKSRQKLSRRAGIEIVTSADEASTLTATVRVAARGVKLRGATRKVGAGSLTRLVLKAPASALSRLKKKRGGALATVTIVATDAAGNKTTRRLRVRVTA
jgi:NTE family protein